MIKARVHKIYQIFRPIISYQVIPILFFYLLGRRYYIMRPLVNADFFIVGILGLWLPWQITSGVYFLVLANEIICHAAPLYHLGIGEFLISLTYARFVSFQVWFDEVVPLLVACVLISIVGSFLGRTRNRAIPATTLCVCGVLVCLLDVMNGTSFLPLGLNSTFINANIAYSGIRRTTLAVLELANRVETKFTPLRPEETATETIRKELKSRKIGMLPPNVVVVIVESMGRFLNPAAEKLWLSRFSSVALSSRYHIHFGEVPFTGRTIQGEFRELCQVQLLNYGHSVPSNCLPELLKKNGYETIALHGFTNQFYRRYEWYPMLGFDKVYFAEEMRGLGYNRTCGAGFVGICDADVLQQIHKELLQGKETGKSKFIYWMTLNSHLPFAPGAGSESSFPCDVKLFDGQDSPKLCSYAKLVDLVLSGLAELAADPEIPPTQFVIVGDHSPAFKRLNLLPLFDAKNVPSIDLIPRGYATVNLAISSRAR